MKRAKKIFDYIEVFFKRKRRHGDHRQLSPADFEMQHFGRLKGVWRTGDDSMRRLFCSSAIGYTIQVAGLSAFDCSETGRAGRST